MKLRYGIAVAALMMAVGMWFFKTPAQKSDVDTLVVGIAADYAPYSSINHTGEYEGFDIDVAHAIAQKMGKKLEFKDYGSMAPLFMALEQESVDALLWGISITQDRLAKVDFVPYHGAATEFYPLIFWNVVPESITLLADCNGLRICVEPASAQSKVLEKYQEQITLVPTERVDDAFLMIQQGKADAALVDPAIAKKFKAAYPEIKIVEIALSPEDQSFGMGIPVKKTNQALKDALQKAVDQLKSDGVIEMLEKKWGVA